MKYLRHINESNFTKTIKDNIDWEIIDDAKDMSLDSLDESAKRILLIEIKYELYRPYIRHNIEILDIYSCVYRYKNIRESWEDHTFYKEEFDINNIKYYFYIIKIIEDVFQDIETVELKETYELQERLKLLYHDKIEDIIEKGKGGYFFARRKDKN